MMKGKSFTLFAVVIAIVALLQVVSASVIGIDVGTDWLKVSIVKPGVPLDIVLNRESKRKTNALITLRDGIRYFGTDATGLSSRFPESTFPALKSLVGRLYSDEIAAEYRGQFGNGMIEDPERGTISFKLSDDTVYTIEELMAMQLAHVKRQAEIFGGEGVSGAVIMVPSYFNQYERQAMLDAAELAKLKVLNLMNDGTAVALNYAMTRSFTETQYHIFLDMGAGSSKATLAKFHNIQVKDFGKKNKTVVEVEIKGVGYDTTLGGFSIDTKLQKMLADEFTKVHGNAVQTKITDSPRAMSKLLKEANRVKQILSANQETIASIEGLHEDIDFRVKVTRAQLEAMLVDFLQRVPKPIKSVMAESKVPLANISSVVLVGGGVRILLPNDHTIVAKKQPNHIVSKINRDRIAQNVNQDEAGVLGAGFRAAGISKQFKVKDIRIKDVVEFPVEVVYEVEPKSKEVHTTLFSKASTLGAKKLMNFKRVSDFEFTLGYKDAPTPIYTAKVSGLTEAMTKFQESAPAPPKVKAQIEMNESGMVTVSDASASFEIDQGKADSPSLKDTVLSFFGAGKKKNSDDGDAEDAENPGQPAEEIKLPTDKNDTNTTEADLKAKKITTERVKLTLELTHNTIKPMASLAKTESKRRMAKMDAQDADRRAREEALNGLESFIYSSKEFLYNDDVEAVSTEEQREAFKIQLHDAQDWLYDNSAEGKTEDFRQKLDELKVTHTPILERRNEMRDRPKVINDFADSIKTWRDLIDSFKANATEEETEDSMFTLKELAAADKALDEADAWLKEKQAAQAKVPAHETPVVLISDIQSKRTLTETEIFKLFSKPKKQPKKKSKSSSSSSSTTTGSATETASETASATETGEATETPLSEEQPAIETENHDEL
ncbi:Hypoxia up-regulated protein 1 [Blyttiomyces sp. JEL0837]|nr:Hypoxia up-regulated protein 1 [Blyttiomyces sp. JEL0837]